MIAEGFRLANLLMLNNVYIGKSLLFGEQCEGDITEEDKYEENCQRQRGGYFVRGWLSNRDTSGWWLKMMKVQMFY